MTNSPHLILFVLVDGVGDVSYEEINDKTPLEASNTPTMDYIARYGINGLLDPVEPGLACGSDTAHLSLFQYDPRIWYRGRGAFESIGAGIDMESGDIAFKSNFATLDESSQIVVSRRADRNFEVVGPELCNYLNLKFKAFYDEYQITFQYATEHRCGIRIRGPGLSDRITNTDPLKDGLALRHSSPLAGFEEDLSAKNTSKLINDISSRITEFLNLHPLSAQRRAENKPAVNCILFRGCGMVANYPNFIDKHEDLNTSHCFGIAPTCMIKGFLSTIGIPTLSHLDHDCLKLATGSFNSDLVNGKARAYVAEIEKCLRNAKSQESIFTFLHVKAVDDAGHDNRLDLKIQNIEKVDDMLKFILDYFQAIPSNTPNITGPIIDNRPFNMTIMLTGDHSTLVSTGDHSTEPVPITLFHLKPREHILNSTKDGDLVDECEQFDEISCSSGYLGRIPGSQLMPTLKKFIKLHENQVLKND